MSDHGFYECYAKNNYSEDRSIFEIIVQNVPDRIEKIFTDNSNRISWIKPFDGNAKILNYILRIQHKQGKLIQIHLIRFICLCFVLFRNSMVK